MTHSDPHAPFLRAIADRPGDPLPRLYFADYLDERGERDAACEQRLEVALRDVLESPDDDGPRMKYAEVCEQYGMAERGEFVRVQCELAALPRVPIVENASRRNRPPVRRIVGQRFNEADFARAAELVDRERGLKKRVCLWLDPLGTINSAQWSTDPGGQDIRCGWPTGREWIEADFRRGFIHSIRCTAEEWQRPVEDLVDDRGRPRINVPTIGQSILARQPVERVEFNGSTIEIRNLAVPESEQLWAITVTRQNMPTDRVTASTRSNLVSAMPNVLREWGIGEPPRRRLPAADISFHLDLDTGEYRQTSG